MIHLIEFVRLQACLKLQVVGLDFVANCQFIGFYIFCRGNKVRDEICTKFNYNFGLLHFLYISFLLPRTYFFEIIYLVPVITVIAFHKTNFDPF